MRQAAIKFARNMELLKKHGEVGAQIQDARESGDIETRDAADCMWLIEEQATRPGSDRDTKAKVQAFGATTLRAEHVVEAADGIRLQFIGKEGVYHDHLIRNPQLADMLVRRKRDAGTDGRLFQTTDGKLRTFANTLDSGRFTPKDFRTLKATSLAIDEIQKMPAPTNAVDRRKAMVTVATVVSRVLGNKPLQALESYINPMVFSAWSVA
jgi:DNA topoisomerase-1